MKEYLVLNGNELYTEIVYQLCKTPCMQIICGKSNFEKLKKYSSFIDGKNYLADRLIIILDDNNELFEVKED